MTDHTIADSDPPPSNDQGDPDNAGSTLPFPLIGLAFVVLAVGGLALLLSLTGGDEQAITPTTNVGGTIEAPFALDVPQRLSTNILQTKGVADWELTVSPLIESREIPESNDLAFAMFDASAELIRTEQSPVTTLESFEFTILGGDTGMAYGVSTFEEDCTAGNSFDISQLVTEEEGVEGSVCIAIPVEDITHPDTLIAVRFNLGELRFFG